MLKTVLALLFTSVAAQQPTVCPVRKDIQLPMMKNFNVNQFIGPEPYYELAYHDKTQPLSCGCQIARKSLWNKAPKDTIYDDWSIQCPYYDTAPLKGHIYNTPLYFNFTSEIGVLDGWSTDSGPIVYPDTVVAYGAPDKAGDPYRWALEFQCNMKDGAMVFYAVNFYSRARVGPEATRNFNEMQAAAAESGIDVYWNNDPDYHLKMVDHTNCVYREDRNELDSSETQFLI